MVLMFNFQLINFETINFQIIINLSMAKETFLQISICNNPKPKF